MQVADIYNGFLTIITNFLYGGSLVNGSFEQMCAIITATFCTYLLIAIPFVGLFCSVRALLKVWRT